MVFPALGENISGLAVKLTQRIVDALVLPEGKSEVIFFDEDLPGFGLRIRAGGARTWVFQFKIGSQNRRLTLGNAEALSPARARETAAELHAMVRLGRDPVLAKNEGRVRAAETVGATVQTYLDRKRKSLRPKSYAEAERHLMKYCKSLHGLPLARVDRRAIAAKVSAIAGTSGRKPEKQFTIGSSVNAAVAAFTKCLADLGKTDGVQVNCIHPSLVETERQWKRIRAEVERTGETEAKVREHFCREMHITRYGTVEDVADLVTFLVSARATWMHGATIDLDGGEIPVL